ncbi:carboxypeptidase-like regulatory domain-containing protein [Niabella hibiscisoli]|uniref:carboxypeptidase-like regulatory domain-containing protein n=1 Tax=Niabella hibiscisoli TaxID=1825928 RepID=UPI001F0F5BA8|nr:carboxypeptidase-like regulatory domain-containing protein [Niabella hibiscisoli]MCH5719374.1 carboxypeptidase-like regulatory domain-containing protein [Niabella hibiscisoli]
MMRLSLFKKFRCGYWQVGLVLLFVLQWRLPATALSVKLPAKMVTGTITSQAGDTLAGVSIVEKGSTNGTTSNVKGFFSISIAGPESVLEISYVGYKTQEIRVGNMEVFNIILQPGVGVEAEEVVITAYGKVKKEA